MINSEKKLYNSQNCHKLYKKSRPWNLIKTFPAREISPLEKRSDVTREWRR